MSTTIETPVPFFVHLSLPIEQDSLFCSTCLNLSPRAAAVRHPLAGLFHRPSEGNSKYDGWAVAAPLHDIYEKAAAGCASCEILKQALKRLTARKFDLLNIRIYILFRNGDALKLRVCQMGENVTEDDEVGFDGVGFEFSGVFDGPSLPQIQLELAHYELYTTPDSICPWPTIGSKMNQHLPKLDYELSDYRWNGGVAKHIDQNPGSESSIQKMKALMDSCSRNHDFCKKAEALVSRVRQLPKRVVDVGDDNNNGIHVYEHTDERKDRYVALSHSWGGTKHTLLQHKNSKERFAGIPYDELPQLYKDAVAITRRFGIRYIWIDSLCIIQGDDKDFAEEGAKMALIYEGAEFVLAATSSPNGDTGLCAPRKSCEEISCKTVTGQLFSIYAREECAHQVLGDEDSLWRVPTTKHCSPNWAIHVEDPDKEDSEKEDLKEEDQKKEDQTKKDKKKQEEQEEKAFREPTSKDYPLHYRAWCLQERLLGTKVIHFARQELLYECLTALECECGFFEDHRDDYLLESSRAIKSGRQEFDEAQLEDIPFSERMARIPHMNSFRRGKGLPEPAKIDDEQKSSSRHREIWRDLVVQYTQKKVSEPEDGLTAIAGLAQRWYNSKATGRYLAGLWEQDLLNGLRWMPDTKEPENKLVERWEEWGKRKKLTQQQLEQVDKYIAPSWSWASIQRGVAWKDDYDILDLDNYFVTVNSDTYPPACQIKIANFEYGPVSSGYISLKGEIMTVDFWMQECKSDATPNGQDTIVHLVKNGVRSPATAIDSLKRLEAQPVLVDEESGTGHAMRQLYCLRFCSKPFPTFGGGGGVGSEGALLLVDARPAMKDKQRSFVRDHEFVFERIGFTYGYMCEDWDHALDAREIDLFLI